MGRKINNIVKELRVLKKWSQATLADEANTTRQTIIRIEKGEKPSFDVAMEISKAFNKPVNEIFFTEDVKLELQKETTA
ncbi:helix-turn-helix transcriptional regulator [Dethiothermospora halolimnae]|uniref:helix-turn-helix transcriptional regulator n=1 Tax=Dethiothermospora halolimnae TaxID=3114390 RepID=UPI003CCB84E7